MAAESFLIEVYLPCSCLAVVRLRGGKQRRAFRCTCLVAALLSVSEGGQVGTRIQVSTTPADAPSGQQCVERLLARAEMG